MLELEIAIAFVNSCMGFAELNICQEWQNFGGPFKSILALEYIHHENFLLLETLMTKEL